MIRKIHQEPEEKVDRWMVSYADFITLLFAFFVVMYSISQINEGKYKLLSESLLNAFDNRPKSSQPFIEGPLDQRPSSADPIIQPGLLQQNQSASDEADDQNYADVKEFSEIQAELESRLDTLIDNDLVSIKRTKDWLEIDLRSALLFASGSDRLQENAFLVIDDIAQTLVVNQQRVQVRGHTDNIPIQTERFGSNWELSTARAVAVVRLLQNYSLSPKRLSAQGYSEYQPIAENTTADGRAKNRRVTIAVSRYRIEDGQEHTKIVDAPVDEKPSVETDTATVKSEETTEPRYDVVRLPGGGLLIRGKSLPKDDKDSEDKNKSENNQ